MPALKISAPDFGLINAALRGEPSKYVDLDIFENVITSISSSAFSGCTSLVEIKMPDRVTSIGNNAFNGCTNLKTISVPSAVTSIGYNAFTGTEWLKEKEKVEGLVYFGNAVLIKYKGTVPATINNISNDTKVIAGRAFYNCTNIASVTIPEGVTNIGEGAFQGCTGLTTITIPNAVTSIGNSAFQNCTGLTTITIPNTVTSIGNSAFSGCTGLTSVIIPSYVASSENSAFIGSSAFNGCTKLDSVTFQGTIPSNRFSTSSAFPGDLRTKFYAPVTPNGPPTTSGTPGQYTRPSGGTEWTKQ
jgi:putative transposon-encoded protein